LRRGGVEGGGSISVDRCIDCLEHAGHVLENVVVPESQYTIAIGFEIPGARFVRRIAGMLPAVDFDDKLELMAGEIGEVRTDGRLASKVVLLEWRLPQMLPELLFGFGRVTAQNARAWYAVVG
jgi:hypothetical protein